MITAWLRIHYTLGGRAAFLPMYEKYPDPQAICRALENRTEARGLLSRISPDRFFAFDTTKALAAEQLCRENGWRIVPFPSGYYPERLRLIKDPPAVLFVRGDPEILRNPRAVAVVGTRTATRRAADAAVLLGEALSQAGVTTVSGGAYGIDSAVALGACSVPGAGCITVLGRGFDPAKDANRLPMRTVYVTELFPGLSARTFNFPTRNRLISGISAGAVVMEAGGKSGSLITAGCAVRQGRPVFVPDAASLPSPGCAALVSEGAREIACPRDCVEALFPELPAEEVGVLSVRWCDAPRGRYEASFYGGAPGEVPQASVSQQASDEGVSVEPPTDFPSDSPDYSPPQTPVAPEANSANGLLPDGLSPEALAVAQALGAGPRYVDEIIDRLGIPAPKVQVAVTELELEDVIAVGPGGCIHLLPSFTL